MSETNTNRNQHRLNACATSDPIVVGWTARSEPLSPIAVGARGNAAQALARRLLLFSDNDLAQLTGVAGDGLLLVVGTAELLPWVDGVVYFGRQEPTSSLLMPTTVVPDVPLALFESALLKRPGAVGPLAVFLNPTVIVSVAKALPVKREVLRSWLESNESAEIL